MADYPDPNPGKEIEIRIKDGSWSRWPIKTPVIQPDTDLVSVLKEALHSRHREGDLVLIAESVVAITQGRAYRFKEIRPSRAAAFLARFVRKVPWGIGLGSPQTMELAIRECGLVRIFFAAMVSGMGKVFGIRGLFYRLAGPQARLIDGPCENTLPPFNEFATLGPRAPQKSAEGLSRDLGCPVAIIDANDLGTRCIGAYPVLLQGWKSRRLAEALTRDNPGGQSHEQTPVILGRKKS